MKPLHHINSANCGVYTTASANESIILYDGRIEIDYNNFSYVTDGRIVLEWMPSPSIKFNLTYIGQEFKIDFNNDDINIKVPGSINHTRGFITYRNLQVSLGRQTLNLSGILKEPLTKGTGQNLSYVVFHLPNFVDTLGEAIGKNDNIWPGRSVLIKDDLTITIDKVENYKATYDSLKSIGGFAITHIGKIERKGGYTLDSDKVNFISEALFYFFSFAQGRWTTPILKIGYDEQNNPIWEEWKNVRVESWKYVDSWFESQKPQVLSSLWINFYSKFGDATWSEPLQHAIYWYIASNTLAGGLEGSLILAQAAHELMSWTLFVTVEQHNSESFDKMYAADKLRKFLMRAKIPLDIPISFYNLQKLAKDLNLSDGPHAITFIRNKFVHPSPKNFQQYYHLNSSVLFEANKLSLWYLELIILFVLDYQDEYSNRTHFNRWKGDVELVPWKL